MPAVSFKVQADPERRIPGGLLGRLERAFISIIIRDLFITIIVIIVIGPETQLAVVLLAIDRSQGGARAARVSTVERILFIWED